MIARSGLRQKDVEEKIGLSRGYLSKILSQEYPLTANVAFRLSKLLGVSTDWLLSGYSAQRVAESDYSYEVTVQGHAVHRDAWHCPHCLAEVRPEIRSCPHCGGSLEWGGPNSVG